MTTLIQIKQGIGMDKDRQNRLLVTAAKHYDYEYSTSEARAGLQLTSMLLGLPLTTEASGDWFDASLLGDKKIATRIWRDFDTGSDIEQRKFFKIEVGITSPEGTMQQDDPQLLVIEWAKIDFDYDANGRHYPRVYVMDLDATDHDSAEEELEPGTNAWDEIHFTVERATLAYSQQPNR